MISRNNLRIGIDLGTTNSCCFYELDGKAIPLHTEQGGYILPSCVDYKGDDKILVGQLAKDRLAKGSKTSHVVSNSKRIIGKDFDDPSVQQLIDYCGVPIMNQGGKPVFKINEHKVVTPKEVATEIIKTILSQVRKVCERDPTHVCVTIPARFGHNERVLTRQAVIDAGIPKSAVVIQNEPTVAAICYGEDFANEGSHRVLVYDLGGGTFDLSIVEINNGHYKVVCHEGDPNLGGADFDRLIMEWVETKYYKEYHESLFPSSMPAKISTKYRNMYLQEIEEYKASLSSEKSVDMTFDFIKNYNPVSLDDDDDDDEEENEFIFPLTTCVMNTILKDKIDKTLEMINSLLTKRNLTKSDIDAVILVGGSTRLHIVQEELSKMFGSSKLKFSVNPDECVAKGACLSLIHKENITEVTSKSLGMGVTGNRVYCIIPTQTPLPAKQTIRAATSADYLSRSSSCVIQCYQEKVEELMPIDNSCVILHPFRYYGFESKPKGQVTFLTTFTIDRCGMLSVRVVEEKTNKVLIDDMQVEVHEL